MASVFEQIGGKPAVSATVDGLYERLLADPVIAPYFAGTDMDRQTRHMRAFMALALGVPGDLIQAIGDKLAPLRDQIVTMEEERKAA